MRSMYLKKEPILSIRIKKEYLKSQITVAFNSPHVLEHLIDEMLETNSGRVFSDNDLTFLDLNVHCGLERWLFVLNSERVS